MKKLEAHTAKPIHFPLEAPTVLTFAWVAMLLLSSLPNILLQELHITLTLPLLWIKMALLLGFILLSFRWETAERLWTVFFVLLVMIVGDALFSWVSTTPGWQRWFGDSNPGGLRSLFGGQLLRLGLTAILIIVLSRFYHHPREFFLAKGETNAVAAPMPWFGMNRPAGWRRLGIILTLCITLGTLTFLVLASPPSSNLLAVAAAQLPMIFLISAMNAFSEEVSYRAAILAPLHHAVGNSQALLLTAVLFGLWHFYGVPYGIVGVLMSGGLGWVLGKSMLETRGIFWAWFIHFWKDVAIFIFIFAGSISPGG